MGLTGVLKQNDRLPRTRALFQRRIQTRQSRTITALAMTLSLQITPARQSHLRWRGGSPLKHTTPKSISMRIKKKSFLFAVFCCVYEWSVGMSRISTNRGGLRIEDIGGSVTVNFIFCQSCFARALCYIYQRVRLAHSLIYHIILIDTGSNNVTRSGSRRETVYVGIFFDGALTDPNIFLSVNNS